MSSSSRGALLVVVALALSACGFQLRGDAPMGLKSLHVSSAVPSTVAVDVRRALTGGPTRIVTKADDAEAHLRILAEKREKTIFTLTGAGRVYEYQLQLLVSYQVTVPGEEEPLIAPSEIDVRRIVTYSESAPLAKEAEEQLLFKDMQVDAAGQILRRIAILRRAS
jgi:LPS-assembly lipoprotein